mgnify:CR=1 FL=1
MLKALKASEMLKLGQAALEKYGEDYEHIGVRIQENPEEVGSIMDHSSHVWDDGHDTGEELDGVCAIDATADYLLGSRSSYLGRYILILGADYREHGYDDGEIIMDSPVVLECREI